MGEMGCGEKGDKVYLLTPDSYLLTPDSPIQTLYQEFFLMKKRRQFPEFIRKTGY
jgi:hypothetical protein